MADIILHIKRWWWSNRLRRHRYLRDLLEHDPRRQTSELIACAYWRHDDKCIHYEDRLMENPVRLPNG